MYSVRLINLHFWMSTIGTVFYIASMWVNGLMQGLMWRATNIDGTLTYSFAEALEASYAGYYVRALGGLIFLSGMFVMAYNVWMTTTTDKVRDEMETEATPVVNIGRNRHEYKQSRKKCGLADCIDAARRECWRHGGTLSAGVSATKHQGGSRFEAIRGAGSGRP